MIRDGRPQSVILSRRSAEGAKRGEGPRSSCTGHPAGLKFMGSFAALRRSAAPPAQDDTLRYAVRRLPSAVFALIALTIASTTHAQTSTTPPQLPGKVGITQKLNAPLPLDVIFRDENGRAVRLGDYFKSGRPVLLNFVYFRCPMLCPTVLESLTNSLTEMRGSIGQDFDVLTISIDPRDQPKTALEKKSKYVKRYGRQSAWDGWHFLTGYETGIHRVTDAVGFNFAYDAQRDQFAHGTTLLAITPDGHVSRYFNGFEYRPRDLRLGLVEASKGKIGTVTDTVLLLCYHYDPVTGKYSRNAMLGMRAGGVATMLGLGGFIFFMIRSERRRTTPLGH